MTRKRIFIVEDEIITAMNEKECLEDLGYKVTGIAATGEEAIEIMGKDKPDLVIMDLKLAGEIDGIEAASKITSEHGVPVIFVTAYGSKSMLNPDEVDGSVGYIEKPFTKQELKAHIEVALGQNSEGLQ